MIQIISEAIQEQLALRFLYKNEWREVEPHTYGRSQSGVDTLCAWQISGQSGTGFRLFFVDRMSIVSLGDSFSGPQPGYHRGDQRFSQIYAEL